MILDSVNPNVNCIRNYKPNSISLILSCLILILPWPYHLITPKSN